MRRLLLLQNTWGKKEEEWDDAISVHLQGGGRDLIVHGRREGERG